MPPSVRRLLPSGISMPPFASASSAWVTNACARSGPRVRTVRQIVARGAVWVSPSWAAMAVAILVIGCGFVIRLCSVVRRVLRQQYTAAAPTCSWSSMVLSSLTGFRATPIARQTCRAGAGAAPLPHARSATFDMALRAVQICTVLAIVRDPGGEALYRVTGRGLPRQCARSPRALPPVVYYTWGMRDTQHRGRRTATRCAPRGACIPRHTPGPGRASRSRLAAQRRSRAEQDGVASRTGGAYP